MPGDRRAGGDDDFDSDSDFDEPDEDDVPFVDIYCCRSAGGGLGLSPRAASSSLGERVGTGDGDVGSLLES